MLRAAFLTLALLVCACASDPDVAPQIDAPDAIIDLPDPETVDRRAEERLIGTWRSTTDASYLVGFDDGQFTERYEGDVDGGAAVMYRVEDTCEEADRFLVTTDDRCYYLADLTDDMLQLSMIGGRGSTIEFRREID